MVKQHTQVSVNGFRPNGKPFFIVCDEGVSEAVKKLNEAGAKTTNSCEATGSAKCPYILFKVPNKSTLMRCMDILVDLYGKKYTILFTAGKKSTVGFYCTTAEDYLRSWYGKLMSTSEQVFIIPKLEEENECN